MRSADELRALDRTHYLHPFTDHKALGARGTRIIERAEGVWLQDSEGHRILDGMSGLWCVALGYGRRELAEAAHSQLLQLPYYNSFFQCTNPPAIELAAALAEVTPPQFRRAFFTSSGSEANDTLLRMVRRYWELRGEPQRQIVISRWNAYHGSTVAGASLGGMAHMHAQGGLPIPGISHIGQPYWFERGGELDPAEFGLRAARELEQRILEIGPNKVAAFIGEPVQGAGGVIIPPETYWPEIQRIVDRYGMDWRLRRVADKQRVLLLVSKFDHCLGDLLYRHGIGELDMHVAGIVSNHPADALSLTLPASIPYHHLPITKETKPQQEAQIKEIIEREKVDLVVLARYMQVLPPELVDRYPSRIINIHPSLLPYYPGANAYRQAFEEGVRVCGCTAHFVTEQLDQGPVILQDVFHIKVGEDTLDDVKSHGKALESEVLARAVQLFVTDQLVVKDKKVIFRPGMSPAS